MVGANSKFRTNWDLFIMIMAVWNCIAIPLDFAFSPAVAGEAWWKFIDTVIDVIFVVDILVTFRTTYIRSGGQEVVKPYKIAKSYIKGRFLLDFLSVFPFTLVSRST